MMGEVAGEERKDYKLWVREPLFYGGHEESQGFV
jgi:hypothetical protein